MEKMSNVDISEIRALQYLPHIQHRHMDMTGEDLALHNVGCPTCNSKLVKRNKARTPTMFVACDKSNRAYCPFSIGMNETLEERSRRIYNKLKQAGEVIGTQQTGMNSLGAQTGRIPMTGLITIN